MTTSKILGDIMIYIGTEVETEGLRGIIVEKKEFYQVKMLSGEVKPYKREVLTVVDNPENTIIEIVNNYNGMKAVELVTEAVCSLLKYGELDVPKILSGLVATGRLIELEYCVPNMAYRTKSFYLPAGSDNIKLIQTAI